MAITDFARTDDDFKKNDAYKPGTYILHQLHEYLVSSTVLGQEILDCQVFDQVLVVLLGKIDACNALLGRRC